MPPIGRQSVLQSRVEFHDRLIVRAKLRDVDDAKPLLKPVLFKPCTHKRVFQLFRSHVRGQRWLCGTGNAAEGHESCLSSTRTWRTIGMNKVT